jgi:tRNA(Ile)-lysidine synthase
MIKVEEKLIDEFRALLPNYSGDRILVAVSGGVDSMVSAAILKKYNYPITVIHCNFQLRKKDSDDDALFVKKWAKKNKVPYLEKKFKVKKEKGESLQMTARNLRYKWFYETASKEGYGYIVTAHHLNDSIETSLMNIIRGTGIAGLTGIPATNGKIIRPMLRILRSEIEEYAIQKKISWREDKTNKTTKYKRNKIRHELIPLLTTYNPNFLEVYGNNIYNWQHIAKVHRQAMSRLKTEMVHFDEAFGGFKISVLELMGRGINEEMLYELVADFGYNADQAAQMLEAVHNQPGKKFYSEDHVLLIDRLFILIKPVDDSIEKTDTYTIENNLPVENEQWEVGLIETKKLSTLHTGPHEILLDYKALVWPIQVRKWKAGDKFTPMGMKGQKKIADFLTDLKTDRFKKDDTWVVESGKGKIAGVIGLRPDEKYKISKNTQLCLYIKRKTHYL